MFPRHGKYFHSPNIAKYGLQAAASAAMLRDRSQAHVPLVVFFKIFQVNSTGTPYFNDMYT